ncbi:MAG: hemophore-related protein [Mycobacterium sp.]
MAKMSIVKLAAATGFVALSWTAGAGIATAQPDTSVLVNTTCSYGQVMSALNATRPDLAAEFNDSRTAQAILNQFLAASPADRQNLANTYVGSPMFAEYIDPIMQVAGICNGY